MEAFIHTALIYIAIFIHRHVTPDSFKDFRVKPLRSPPTLELSLLTLFRLVNVQETSKTGHRLVNALCYANFGDKQDRIWDSRTILQHYRLTAEVYVQST